MDKLKALEDCLDLKIYRYILKGCTDDEISGYYKVSKSRIERVRNDEKVQRFFGN